MKFVSIQKLPSRVFRKFTNQKPVQAIDPEWCLATLLCSRDRLAVDVGADAGNFAATVAPHALACVAFEPRAHQALQLIQRFRQEGSEIEVQPVALSNKAGVVQMRVLVNDPGRSTIDGANPLEDPDGSPMQTVRVPTLRLDDYHLHNLGLLKIDVEGHELAVLQGGVTTIQQSMPAIYIEVEDRHNAGANSAVRDFLLKMDYEGFFFLDGKLLELHNFNLSLHQNPANIGGWKDGWQKRGVYVNNFFYLPKGRSAQFMQLAVAAGLL